MSIWILAVLVLTLGALAGWRQGGIRAAIAFAGIFCAWLLAVPCGKIFHPLLPWFGVANPIYAWIFAPICGFIFVTIIFAVIAFNVHRKVDVHYRYQASELRLALWQRLNTRLGICVGLLNGAAYFILVSFVFFNFAYWTTQISAGAASQPSWIVRHVNSLGWEMESSGVARAATAVDALPPMNYQLADLAGFLMQNPQAAPRLATYPGLTSLWERDDMQSLVADSTLTNAPAAGASIGDILDDGNVRDFLKNKEMSARVFGIFATNGDDLTNYLQTGKSPKYDAEKLVGNWAFNVNVTLAWLRQSNPKIQASEMRGIRALWSAAYAQTTILVTGDNQVFVKNFPRFVAQPQKNQPLFNLETWKGDWSRDGDTGTLHVTLNSDDKFMTATTTDGLRLSVKDGRNLLIFDRAD